MTRARKWVGCFLLLTTTSLAFLASGCGRPDDAEANSEGGTPLAGKTSVFQSQCPLGTVSEGVPLTISMVDCGTVSTGQALKTPPQPLRFEVDCNRLKIQVIGTKYRKPADGYNLTVDGAINLSELYGGPIELPGDSVSNTPCVSYSTLDLSGAVSCGNPVQPSISMSAQWNLGKAKPDTVAPSTLRECNLPASCVLRTSSKFTQCP